VVSVNRADVKIGDTVVIKAQGLTYRSWKQRYDGGKLVSINGKTIKHDCATCVDAKVDGYTAPCKYCSMHQHWLVAVK
jgi:hypothetical protein